MILVTACLAFAGCVSLALSQDRKWKAVTDTPPVKRTKTAIRIAGGMLLGVALAVRIAVEGPGFAVLTWTLQIATAGFIVAMVLGFRPRLFKQVARLYAAIWS